MVYHGIAMLTLAVVYIYSSHWMMQQSVIYYLHVYVLHCIDRAILSSVYNINVDTGKLSHQTGTVPD